MTIQRRFKDAGNDGREFRPAPFWIWNDKLEPDELKRQVGQMKRAGLGGYFNLLGPHHHFDGEPVAVGPLTFKGKRDWTDSESAPERTWVNQYNFVPFGLRGEVIIQKRMEKPTSVVRIRNRSNQ